MIEKTWLCELIRMINIAKNSEMTKYSITLTLILNINLVRKHVCILVLKLIPFMLLVVKMALLHVSVINGFCALLILKPQEYT